MPTDEEKLLAILAQPDVNERYEPGAEDGEPEASLEAKQRETLAALLNSEMPSPEEIIRDAKIAEHNAAVQARRQKDLAKRRERRAKRGKLKKHRRG